MTNSTTEQILEERQRLATESRELQAKIIALIGNEAYIAFGTNRTHITWLSVASDEVTFLAEEENGSTEAILNLIGRYPNIDTAYGLVEKYENPKQFKELCASLMATIEETTIALFGDKADTAFELLDEINRVQTRMALLKFQMNSKYGRLTK